MKQLFIFLALLPVLAYAEESLTFCFENKAFPPYYLDNGNRLNPEHPGATIELHQLVADEMNINVAFKRANWSNCLKRLKQGKVQAVIQANYDPRREEFAVFPMDADGKVDTRYHSAENHYMVYKRKDSPVKWTGTSFNHIGNHYISAQKGYMVADMLRDSGVNVWESRSIRSSLNFVKTEKAAAAIELDSMVNYLKYKNPALMDGLVRQELPYLVTYSYLMFSKAFARENPELVKSYWEHMRNIRNSMQYHGILRQYKTGWQEKS